jgi:hypothetical protein
MSQAKLAANSAAAERLLAIEARLDRLEAFMRAIHEYVAALAADKAGDSIE